MQSVRGTELADSVVDAVLDPAESVSLTVGWTVLR